MSEAEIEPTVAPADPVAPEPLGRGTLDRRRILDAAIRLIDRQGLRHLTMRRLGSYLGVEGMALYHYIPGRETLLDGVVETVIDELHDDPELVLIGTDWQGYLRRLARGVRRIALAHPAVFPLIATRPLPIPGTIPPLRSLYWTQTLLSTLQQVGFAEPAAVAAHRAFSAFLVGSLLLEMADADPDSPRTEPMMAASTPSAGPDPADAPVAPAEVSAALQAEFEQGLEWLLLRLSADIH